jgi:hypothetical protein
MQMQSSAAYGGMRPVETLDGWLVLAGLDVAAKGLPSNAAAWDWVDRNTAEGRADYDRYLPAGLESIPGLDPGNRGAEVSSLSPMLSRQLGQARKPR